MAKNQPQSPNGNKPYFILSRILKHQTRTQTLSPEKIVQLSDKFRLSMGLRLNGELSCTNALATFDNNRVTDGKDLLNTKMKDGSLGEQFKKIEENTDKKDPTVTAQKALKQQFDNVFQDSPSFKIVRENFNTLIGNLNEEVQKSPPTIELLPLARLLEKEKGTMVKAMEDQFKHELDNFKTLSQDDDFKKNVKTNLGVTASEYNNFIKGIEGEIKSKQTTQLRAFEQSMIGQSADLRRLHQAEMSRIALIATQLRLPNVRNFVGDQVGIKRDPTKKGRQGDIKYNELSKDALFSIKLEDMAEAGYLRTLSGRKISYNQSAGQYEFKFPGNLDFSYHWGRENHAQNDMRSIVEAVKAGGHKSIEMTVDHANPKNAEEMARMAYQAARDAGFPPEMIQINIPAIENGKKILKKADINSLFDTHPKWKKQIEENANTLEEKRLDPKAATITTLENMKKEVADLRKSSTDTSRPSPSEQSEQSSGPRMK